MDNIEKTIASYLLILNENEFNTYCETHNIIKEEITGYNFTSSDEVMQCMSTLLANGFSLELVLNNPEVWWIYLQTIVDERFHTGISLLLEGWSPANILYFLRACYRFGIPAMSDANYDALEKLYVSTFPQLHIFEEQTYDDDEYPTLVLEALRLCNAKLTKSNDGSLHLTEAKSAAYKNLNSEKSTSIRPVTDPVDAFTFWREAPMCDVIFSLKIDGVNTKASFAQDGSGLELALSRGRATDSIDYTEAIKMMMKSHNIDETLLKGKLTGESFVPLNSLALLQKKYMDKEYKTPKSTAMAMLRAPSNFDTEDFKHLYLCAFDYAELPKDKVFESLSAVGFPTPPTIRVKGEEIPRDSLENFNQWMDERILKPLYLAGQELGIGSDGVVMDLLADIHTERKDKYSDSNIAIKYSYWAAKTYQSVVEDIIFEQRRVEASIVLVIKPVLMRDYNTATRVGIGSPDILIKDNVRIGDTIEFERKSEAYNVYLRKVENTAET